MSPTSAQGREEPGLRRVPRMNRGTPSAVALYDATAVGDPESAGAGDERDPTPPTAALARCGSRIAAAGGRARTGLSLRRSRQHCRVAVRRRRRDAVSGRSGGSPLQLAVPYASSAESPQVLQRRCQYWRMGATFDRGARSTKIADVAALD